MVAYFFAPVEGYSAFGRTSATVQELMVRLCLPVCVLGSLLIQAHIQWQLVMLRLGIFDTARNTSMK